MLSVRGAAKKRNNALEFIQNDSIIKSNSGLPKKLQDLPNEDLQHTINVDMLKNSKFPIDFHAVVPKGATLEQVKIKLKGVK